MMLLSFSKVYFLVFDRVDEGQHYHFAANSEAEYNDWIKRIKNARLAVWFSLNCSLKYCSYDPIMMIDSCSYEKLKEKLQKLCEQITEMTGEVNNTLDMG